MSYFGKGCKIVEENRIRGYLKTLNSQIYGPSVPAPSILKKDIGYGQRDTILEDTALPGWEKFENGSRWGGKDVHACFRTDFTVTPEMAGKDIWMQLSTGAVDIWNTDNPQFLIYINKKIVCGMDMNHHEVRITKNGVPGEVFEIGIYAYSNSATISDYFKLFFMEKHEDVEALYYDVKVPFDAAMENPPDSLERIETLKVLNEVVNKTELRVVPSEEFYESVITADKWLRDNFYSSLDEEKEVTVHSIGHTHIDVAWKWPVRQTREKAVRSFSTVLNYMEDYPEYRFMSSQPQLYEFVKEEAPEIYERIKERIKEGRWETEGAMWLEADCNLTSGEALVRQILKGEEFFNREFGTGDNKILWLPDVFGYSAALPQILKKSGIEYFMTTKINWNEVNKMPHDVLLWKGIDGSEILTYFITTTNHKLYPELDPAPRHETTYNGRQNVSQVMGTWQRFSDKELLSDVLTCYGHGDGGGGPTREMLEEDRRMAQGLPGMPVTKQTFAREFFDLISGELEGKKIPKWNGELYLEYHRGTYTSQAHNKKNNRLAEYKNEDAEWLSCWALSEKESFVYPVEDLDKVWKTTLLNQFHDILPGSSIADVYRVTDKEYEEIFATDKALTEAATAEIFGEGKNLAVLNPCSFDIDAYVETEKGPVLITGIPSKGVKVVKDRVSLAGLAMKESSFTYLPGNRTLVTPLYEVVFNEAGEIAFLYDKTAERSVLIKGSCANALTAFEDRPWEYDCWNIDSYYEEKSWHLSEVTSLYVVEDSFERFTLRVERKFMSSVISQDISFYRTNKRIDFKTVIDWQEQQILLKAAFPVDVLTSKCTCDIQFGNVERPTHRNTSWDEARFEFAAQKWVDVSENGYGAAVLNDCKYGYDVNESTIRLTLLKSGIFPDPNADKGHHEFTYSFMPHKGDFREGKVIEEAYKLNRPVYVVGTAMEVGTEKSLISTDRENVFADTVKLAEDGDGFIVRVHEEYGRRVVVSIDVSALNATAVTATDLCERPVADGDFNFADGKICAEIKPYEILTFRIK